MYNYMKSIQINENKTFADTNTAFLGLKASQIILTTEVQSVLGEIPLNETSFYVVGPEDDVHGEGTEFVFFMFTVITAFQN